MKKRTFCEETKKVIYTKGKKTYCKLDCTLDLFPEYNDVPLSWETSKKLEKKYKNLKYDYGNCFTIHVEAVAICQEGDTFDEKKGRTIAYSKAQRKLYYLISRLFKDVYSYLYDFVIYSNCNYSLFKRYLRREHNFLSKL